MKLSVRFLFVMMFGLLAAAYEARAEDSCVLLRHLAVNLGCSGFGSTDSSVEKTANNDFLVSENFTSDSCLTAKPLEQLKVSQKAECNKWLGAKRKELGKQYISGNCVQTCNPCETSSLLKCETVGSAHYRAK